MNRRATRHGKRACPNCGQMVSTNEAAREAHRNSRKCREESARLAQRRSPKTESTYQGSEPTKCKLIGKWCHCRRLLGAGECMARDLRATET